MLRKQHKVDSSHYDMPLIYYTECHSLHFGRSEFALITGLPFGDVNFGLYTSGELKFRNRVFPHKLGSSVTNLDLIGVIEDEETFQKLCDEDSIRLCLILCLEVIFMGRLLTCPVDDTLFRLVESLEDWNCFPWGEHIWTHLYDQIQNVIEKHSDEHYFGMKKDPKYVPMYTLSGFVFAFQVWIFESFERCNCWWSKDPNVIPRAVGWSKKSIFNRSDCGYLFAKQSTTTSEIRPSKAEYESSWWIRSQLFFRQHVPKAPVAQHHSMYETYLAKLEKSRKRVHSSFRTSSGVLTTLISTPKKWIRDQVISQLNLRVFKLETIIQVLARERKNEYGLLQFKDEFSRLGREFMNSLNILFEELSQPLYTDENLSNDYLVEEELRLCLEAEERMRLEHEKNIIEELSFMVKEAKRMKLEEEKLLQISQLKKKENRNNISCVIKRVGDEAIHKELGDRMERAATTTSSLEAEQDSEVPQDEAEHEESVPTPSNDLQPSGEDSMQLTNLMKRIQRLERRKMSRPTGLKRLRKVSMSRRVESSEDQESLGAPEDASKQGRSIEDIDADVDVSLVDETQERQNDELMFNFGVFEDDVMHVEAKVNGKDKQSKKPDDSTTGEAVTTASIDNSDVPITSEEITLAQTLIQIKAAKPKVVTTAATTTTTTRPKDRGVVVQEPSEFRVPQETQPSSSKDKGKGIMIEPEVPLKRKDQIALDEQIARDIQAKLDAELLEEQKLARKQEEEANIALIESWENTQAMMEADRLLAERLQSKEREELTDEEKAKLFMELMEKRRKHFAALRVQEKRNRPPTKA
ncbi:phospholipase-like protein [Tanacetum coccineum]